MDLKINAERYIEKEIISKRFLLSAAVVGAFVYYCNAEMIAAAAGMVLGYYFKAHEDKASQLSDLRQGGV